MPAAPLLRSMLLSAAMRCGAVQAMRGARRRFAPVGAGQLQYRTLGSGPALVMLPPLPWAGEACLPLASRLASRFTVLIVDPPGYGLSDPMTPAERERGLSGYADAVLKLLRHLGAVRVAMVGQGVGAVIALLAAKLGQGAVAALALDFGEALAPDEPGAATEDRFPDIAPRRDGAHLLTAWDMARSSHLFAPWNGRLLASRLPNTPPAPDAIHRKMLDTIRAGEGYAHAPRLALREDLPALVAGLSSAPLILKRLGSGSARSETAAISALKDADVTPCADEVDAVAQAVSKHFEQVDLPGFHLNAGAAQVDPSRVGLQTLFVETAAGQLLARASFHGTDGPPLVGLHDPAGSSRRLLGVLTPFVGRSPVIALDLPGSGESDPAPASSISIEGYAEAAGEALDVLGVSSCDVMGRYSGGQVGLELAIGRPTLVRSLIHYGIQLFDDAERPALLDGYTPSLAPVWDGSHLVRAWAILRDMSLFWPWFNRTSEGTVLRDAAIDPAALHVRVIDLLKIGDGWRDAYGASFRYPMHARLTQMDKPSLFADMPGAASHGRLARAVAAAPKGEARDLVGDPGAWTRTFESFLQGAA